MAIIRITKEFGFEMAHALWNYNGSCKNIHGHSYKLFVTIKGQPVSDESSPKNGMLIDFKDFKDMVNNKIVDRLDHSLVIYEKVPHDFIIEVKQMFERTILLPFQPTCENLVIHFASVLKKILPVTIALHRVKLYETDTSFAEWVASDNEI